MTVETTTKKPVLKPVEVAAGAGAAVVTAFASSFLGTAGTLTGAAVASVIGTVSTSVLRSSADRSAEKLRVATARLRETRAAAPGGVDPYGTQLFGAPGLAAAGSGPDGLDSAGTPTSPAPAGQGTDPLGTAGSATPTPAAPVAGLGGSPTPGGSGRGRRPAWVALAVGAVLAFAAALAVITGIESAAGKPLAGLVGQETGGGTTIGRATGTDSGTDPAPTPTPTPSGAPSATDPTPTGSPDPTPTGGPTATETTQAPTTEPTSEAPATSAAPAPTATTSPEPTP
jgi:hypothetical protein